jgi:hypothetical protein
VKIALTYVYKTINQCCTGVKPFTWFVVTYVSTDIKDLLLTHWIRHKVKSDINSVEVHPLWRHYKSLFLGKMDSPIPILLYPKVGFLIT